MKNKFKISISTPIGKTYETEEAVLLTADLLEGRIGIMAKHSPIVSSLKVSILRIKYEDGGEDVCAIHGGVLSVVDNEVTILTTNFDWSYDVNVNESQDELKNIEYQLQSDVKNAEAESLNNRHKYASIKIEIAN